MLLSPLRMVFTIIYLKQAKYRPYTVEAVVHLQFMLHVMLFRMSNMFCTPTTVLSVVRLQCPMWLFL